MLPEPLMLMLTCLHEAKNSARLSYCAVVLFTAAAAVVALLCSTAPYRSSPNSQPVAIAGHACQQFCLVPSANTAIFL